MQEPVDGEEGLVLATSTPVTQLLEHRFNLLGNSFLNLVDSEEDLYPLVRRSRSCPNIFDPQQEGLADDTERLWCSESKDGSTAKTVLTFLSKDGGTVGAALSLLSSQSTEPPVESLLTDHSSEPAACGVRKLQCLGEDEAEVSWMHREHLGPEHNYQFWSEEAPYVGRQNSSASSSSAPAPCRGPVPLDVQTVMVQNLPSYMTQMLFAGKLDEEGLEGRYDFLYLPTAFQTTASHGYAFVNFMDPADARWIIATWDKRKPWGRSMERILRVIPAAIQGLDANLARWNSPKMQRVRNPEHRPLIFPNGGQVVSVSIHRKNNRPRKHR